MYSFFLIPIQRQPLNLAFYQIYSYQTFLIPLSKPLTQTIHYLVGLH